MAVRRLCGSQETMWFLGDGMQQLGDYMWQLGDYMWLLIHYACQLGMQVVEIITNLT